MCPEPLFFRTKPHFPPILNLDLRPGRHADRFLAPLIMPEWRNGRRTRLKIWRLHGRMGSSPFSGTIFMGWFSRGEVSEWPIEHACPGCDWIEFDFAERCRSGRSSTLGKRVYLTVPRVRIPPSPPFFCPDSARELTLPTSDLRLRTSGSHPLPTSGYTPTSVPTPHPPPRCVWRRLSPKTAQNAENVRFQAHKWHFRPFSDIF